MASPNFYREIVPLQLPITEVLQQQYFSDVPTDWSVIIADVQNSTAAVAAGKHNDVNLVAAGCLIAALNIAKEKDIEIPFFFGGDGGAVLVPDEMADDVLVALWQHNYNSSRNLGLTMHIGRVSIADIVSKGAVVRIAKMQLGSSYHKALILGNGMKIAEQQIKRSARESTSSEPAVVQALDMTGLQCRWDKVKPPAEQNEIVCYLIETLSPTNQAEVYRQIMLKIDDLYGTLESRSPLSIKRMKLLLSLQKIETEMLVKYGRWKVRYYLATILENLIGFFYFRFNLKLGPVRGREYLSQLIANADTLTIDGRINTIISGKTEKRKEFVAFLSRLEEQGQIVFGHHISKESVMTCYIENMNAKHIHFIDGSDGGYTEAAKELKVKLVANEISNNARSQL